MPSIITGHASRCPCPINHDAERVKAAVSIAHIISETVPLRQQGREHVGLCPFHLEKTPSFTVYAEHYHCYGCGARGDVFDWMVRTRQMSFAEAVAYLGGNVSPPRLPAITPMRTTAAQGNSMNLELAARIWREAIDPHNTIVISYLQSRGLTLPDEPVLRFHPQCPRGSGRCPAIVALMTDPLTEEPRGIHRTFLMPDGSGKADVPKPKMMLGGAGVIRLYEPMTAGLGIAEGIETALAVAQRVGWGPVWATGSDGGVRTFPPLPQRTLNIFADHDDTGAGLKAAHACADRWVTVGLEVLIHAPPPGEDWADATSRLTP